MTLFIHFALLDDSRDGPTLPHTAVRLSSDSAPRPTEATRGPANFRQRLRVLADQKKTLSQSEVMV